jgi:translocator protein
LCFVENFNSVYSLVFSTGIHSLAQLKMVYSGSTRRVLVSLALAASGAALSPHHDRIKATPTTLIGTIGQVRPTVHLTRRQLSVTTPDFGDIAKYGVATGIQFGLLAGALKLFDQVAAARTLPLPLVGVLFCFLSLRSRVASVLDNSRPNREAMKGKATPTDVKRPSWTPPGIAFPVIWLSITALRAVSSALVYKQTGALFSGPLLAMVLHLSVGDTWNTITNIEKRLGVSAVGCVVVWASVMNVIYRYVAVQPIAGRILAPSGVWISIATVLCWEIWRINMPNQPLWPVKGNGESAAFKFSNLGQLQPSSIGGSGQRPEEKPME